MNTGRRVLITIFLTLALAGVSDVVVFSQGTSNTYRIDESFIGPGSNLESGSSGYKLEGQQSTGNIGAGESGSASYGVVSGSTTTADPSLSCNLDATSIDFGAFSNVTTATATATFNVKNYTSYGYGVSLLGGAPSIEGHEITPMTTTGASNPGEEQFGINLVANTSPSNIGSFPEQVPSSDFSYGDATPNYSTPNNYRYVEGETIAAASKSSGQTNYTITYIVNINSYTPGGTYSAGQVILCTGTY